MLLISDYNNLNDEIDDEAPLSITRAPYVAIIDDIEINRLFMEKLTHSIKEVEKVEAFARPEIALEKFLIQQPDLIITDFNMPGMTAPEFLSRLRKINGMSETPVIVVSSYSKRENRREALLQGATDFLTSPFDHFEFQVRVRNLLRLGLNQKLLRSYSESLKSRLISTRLHSMKSFQQTRRHFVSIMDTVPAMIFAISTTGECVFANQYCFEFLGCTGDDLSRLNSLTLIAKAMEQVRFTSQEKNAFSTELKIKDRDGEERSFLVVARPIKGEESGIVVFSGIEISELKHVESSLRLAKVEAETADRAKSAFLANISHEVRTPLNAIIGFSEVMQMETFGPLGHERYKEYMGDIFNSAKHLLFIINEILDFSQIETGKHTTSESEFSILDCIMGVRRMLDRQLTEQKNKVIVEAKSDININADRQKFFQVLINILSNANKATQTSIIKVNCSQKDTGDIIISITDNGIGMTEDEIDIAISNFGRVSNPTVASNNNGVGLGLPISIGFMKLMGGNLDIQSKKGTGTTVSLTLPYSSMVSYTETKQPIFNTGRL